MTCLQPPFSLEAWNFFRDDCRMETWHTRLKAKLDERGWSIAELGRRAGIETSLCNKYVHGRVKQPRGNVMERLARALDVDPLWLQFGVYAEPAPAPTTAGDTSSDFEHRDSSQPDFPFQLDGFKHRLQEIAAARGRLADPDVQRLLAPDYDPTATELADIARELDTTAAFLMGEIDVSRRPLTAMLHLDALYLDLLIDAVLNISERRGLGLSRHAAVSIACAAYEFTSMPGERHRGPRMAEDLALYEARRREKEKAS